MPLPSKAERIAKLEEEKSKLEAELRIHKSRKKNLLINLWFKRVWLILFQLMKSLILEGPIGVYKWVQNILRSPTIGGVVQLLTIVGAFIEGSRLLLFIQDQHNLTAAKVGDANLRIDQEGKN